MPSEQVNGRKVTFPAFTSSFIIIILLLITRKEALARDNVVVCLKEELLDGKQIEFDDASLRIVSVYGKAKGNIMKHVENWRYLVHMQDELHPRNREIDFSSIKNFRILHHLPQVYDLDRFGIQTAPPKVYDYFEVMTASVLTGSFIYSLIHSFTHSLTHSLTYALTLLGCIRER